MAKAKSRAAFMSADLGNSHDIALTEVGDDADGPRKGQVGLNHMAWYMESLDDLRDLYFRIKEKKITIERVSDHGHAIGIYIRDPDGNGIESSYEMPAEQWGHDPNKYFDGWYPKRPFVRPLGRGNSRGRDGRYLTIS